MKKYWHTDLANHILMKNPNLVLHQVVAKPNDGTTLICMPVEHHFRFILLGRVRRGEIFNFGCGVQPLYAAENSFHQSYYDRIADPETRHVGGFSTDNPDVFEVLDRAIPVALERLSKVKSPNDFLSFHRRVERLGGEGPLWAMVASQQWTEASDIVQKAFARWRQRIAPDNEHWLRHSTTQLVKLDQALQTSPAAVLELLRENERNTVAMLKLEKYWQATPFPFELAGKT
jgi:hypothetical protein